MTIKNYLPLIIITVLCFSSKCNKKNDFRNPIIGYYYMHEYKNISGRHKNLLGEMQKIEPYDNMIGEGEIQVEPYSDSGIVIHGHMFRNVYMLDSNTYSFGSPKYPGRFYHNGDSVYWVRGSDDQIHTPDSVIIFISYRGHKVR